MREKVSLFCFFSLAPYLPAIMRHLQSFASAFELYEADVEALTKQVEAARSENAELEAVCREASMAYEVARDAARQASGEQWPGGISATMEAKLGRIKNYRRALTTSDGP